MIRPMGNTILLLHILREFIQLMIDFSIQFHVSQISERTRQCHHRDFERNIRFGSRQPNENVRNNADTQSAGDDCRIADVHVQNEKYL